MWLYASTVSTKAVGLFFFSFNFNFWGLVKNAIEVYNVFFLIPSKFNVFSRPVDVTKYNVIVSNLSKETVG